MHILPEIENGVENTFLLFEKITVPMGQERGATTFTRALKPNTENF